MHNNQMKKKHTLEDLAEILADAGNAVVRILPNGEVKILDTDDMLVKALIARHAELRAEIKLVADLIEHYQKASGTAPDDEERKRFLKAVGGTEFGEISCPRCGGDGRMAGAPGKLLPCDLCDTIGRIKATVKPGSVQYVSAEEAAMPPRCDECGNTLDDHKPYCSMKDARNACPQCTGLKSVMGPCPLCNDTNRITNQAHEAWNDKQRELAAARAKAKLGPRGWTVEEDESLLSWRRDGRLTIEIMALNLGRTQSAVKARIAKLLAGAKPSNRWTDDEDDKLELLYVTNREPLAIIADKMGRTKSALVHRITKLGLHRVAKSKKLGRPKGSKTQKRSPSPVKEVTPKKMARPPTIAELNAESAPRTKRRIPDPVRKPVAEPSRMNAWTEEQDKVLKREWKGGRISNYMLAKRLGKPAPEVTERARELKLGTRTRTVKIRKCMKDGCDNRFAPEDWTREWYCGQHRNEMSHRSEPAVPQDPRRGFQATGWA